MRAPARLSGELLARKGQALPAGGLTYAAMTLDQPLPPAGDRCPCLRGETEACIRN